jgi:Flp pilus assembly protein TadD
MSGMNQFLRFAACILEIFVIIGGSTSAYADSPPTFIVFTIESTTKNSNLAWLGEGIAYSITEQIRIPGISIVDYEKRSGLADDLDLPPSAPLSRASMIRLAERAPADFLVMGSFSEAAENLHIALRLLDLKTMTLGGEVSANGPLSALPQMENELAWLILANSGLNGTYSRADFKERTRSIPNESYANFIRGLSASDEDSRLKFLANAVDLTPDFPEAQFLLGKDYFEESNWNGAAQHLKYALKNAKLFQEAEFMLGTCYLQQNFLERSIRSYSDLLALKESLEVQNNLGIAYLRKGNYPMALQQLLGAQRMAKNSATVHQNLALLRHLQGNDAAARAVLEDVLPSNPDNGLLYYILSRVLESQGDETAAKLATEKARHLGINVEQMNREDPVVWARIFLEWNRRYEAAYLDNNGAPK